jgi:glutathione S-transferase
MLLTHSKTPFTDNRVTGDSWAAFKASGKCANGQLPVLEVGDRCLNQSISILRFVGSQKGYYGPDPFEQHFADSIIDTAIDFEKAMPKNGEGKPVIYVMFGEAMPEETLTMMTEFRKRQWEKYADLLGEKAFFGGASPSIADFYLFASLCSLERNTKGKESQAHVYAALAAEFANNAKMATWADLMEGELSEYLANRGGGTI